MWARIFAASFSKESYKKLLGVLGQEVLTFGKIAAGQITNSGAAAAQQVQASGPSGAAVTYAGNVAARYTHKLSDAALTRLLEGKAGRYYELAKQRFPSIGGDDFVIPGNDRILSGIGFLNSNPYARLGANAATRFGTDYLIGITVQRINEEIIKLEVVQDNPEVKAFFQTYGNTIAFIILNTQARKTRPDLGLRQTRTARKVRYYEEDPGIKLPGGAILYKANAPQGKSYFRSHPLANFEQNVDSAARFYSQRVPEVSGQMVGAIAATVALGIQQGQPPEQILQSLAIRGGFSVVGGAAQSFFPQTSADRFAKVAKAKRVAKVKRVNRPTQVRL